MSTIPGVSFGCTLCPLCSMSLPVGARPPLLVWACERAGMFVGSPGCQSGG